MGVAGTKLGDSERLAQRLELVHILIAELLPDLLEAPDGIGIVQTLSASMTDIGGDGYRS